MSDEAPVARSNDPFDGPLPNRLTRGTLLGCLGMLCVLTMPVLLFLPIERWAVPLWLALLVPLAAFGAAALGTALLARVPAGAPARSRDPQHPLTITGAPPLLERPASAANRLAVVIVGALLLCAVVGYLLASASGSPAGGLVAGILLSGLAGAVLVADGLLVSGWRLAAPALRWVRIPLQARHAPQGAPIALAGLVWLAWALWVALSAGYGIGAGGLSLLTLAIVLAAPLARRAAPRGGPRLGAAAPPLGERAGPPDRGDRT
ncbi:MAG: hypothetical protein IVW57_09430 [Ktedonobacterales bacterium]|nr:hypothetical protein [Ktedonobacterales bacterium]